MQQIVSLDAGELERAGKTETHDTDAPPRVGEPAGHNVADATFFNLSVDLLCIAWFDGYLKRVNPAFGRTFGRSQEELLSAPFLSFVHEHDVEKTKEITRALAAGEQVRHFVNRFRCRDRSYRWVRWATQRSAETSMLYGVGRDITEVREAENRILRIMESTTDSVFTLDRTWRFTYLNSRAVQQIAEGRNLIGMDIWEAFSDARGTKFEEFYRPAMLTQAAMSFEEFYPGQGRWYEAHAFPSFWRRNRRTPP